MAFGEICSVFVLWPTQEELEYLTSRGSEFKTIRNSNLFLRDGEI